MHEKQQCYCMRCILPGTSQQRDIADQGVELVQYALELYYRERWREHRDVTVALDRSLWRVRGFLG